MPTKWITRARYEMAATATKPGVWKLRNGGWYVRGHTTNPKTDRLQEVQAIRREGDAEQAYSWLRDQLHRVASGGLSDTTPRERFAAFATSLLERKVARGDIWSPKGAEKWGTVLEHHLIPAFGEIYMDRLGATDLEAWADDVAARVKRGDLGAATANTHLSVLRVICRAAFARSPGDNPALALEPFNAPPGTETYTEEEPNSLKPEDVPRFLVELRRSWPQHYAMVTLGFSTGLRPSSMRPLRRTGAEPDILWDDGVLLVRRSQTKGEALDRTKTGSRQRIHLPAELVDILRQHCTELDEVQLASDLLFPSVTGGYRSGSVLEKPFAAVTEVLGIRYHVSARAMRRTFQDLCRATEVGDVVARSVSGHATEAMQQRYSTVGGEEQRRGLGKVITLIAPRRAG
jgi:integrase